MTEQHQNRGALYRAFLAVCDLVILAFRGRPWPLFSFLITCILTILRVIALDIDFPLFLTFIRYLPALLRQILRFCLCSSLLYILLQWLLFFAIPVVGPEFVLRATFDFFPFLALTLFLYLWHFWVPQNMP